VTFFFKNYNSNTLKFSILVWPLGGKFLCFISKWTSLNECLMFIRGLNKPSVTIAKKEIVPTAVTILPKLETLFHAKYKSE
jgi:hypothetical protein